MQGNINQDFRTRLMGFGLIAVGAISMATGTARVSAAVSSCVYHTVRASIVRNLRAASPASTDAAVELASSDAEIQVSGAELQARLAELQGRLAAAQARFARAQRMQARCPKSQGHRMVRLRTEHDSSMGEVL